MPLDEMPLRGAQTDLMAFKIGRAKLMFYAEEGMPMDNVEDAAEWVTKVGVHLIRVTVSGVRCRAEKRSGPPVPTPAPVRMQVFKTESGLFHAPAPKTSKRKPMKRTGPPVPTPKPVALKTIKLEVVEQ